MKPTAMFHSLIVTSVLTVALLTSSPLWAECRAGAYTIYSGDTMEYEGERIHLKGVKAPATDEAYAKASEKALQTLVAMNCPVRCFVSERDADGEAIAVCYGGDETEINAAMVRQGYAGADPAYPEYTALEQQAKQERRGIWGESPLQSDWIWPERPEPAPAPTIEPAGKTESASPPAPSSGQ